LATGSQEQATAAPITRYAYKPSLIGRASEFELREEGLSWRIAGRTGLWPYASLAAIRLSYRPVSMQARRFRADIENGAGARVSILSTSWQTAALMAPQDEAYRNFLCELHRRMKEAGSRAGLTAGLRPAIYWVAVTLVTLVMLAIAGLLIMAVGQHQWMAALSLVGFAALFGWQVGGFIRRNRPRSYGFDDLPRTLLP